MTKQEIINWIKENGLTEANLWGADLRGADLWEAHLIRADLTKADLRWADLTKTIFEDNFIYKDGKKVKVKVIIEEINEQ